MNIMIVNMDLALQNIMLHERMSYSSCSDLLSPYGVIITTSNGDIFDYTGTDYFYADFTAINDVTWIDFESVDAKVKLEGFQITSYFDSAIDNYNATNGTSYSSCSDLLSPYGVIITTVLMVIFLIILAQIIFTQILLQLMMLLGLILNLLMQKLNLKDLIYTPSTWKCASLGKNLLMIYKISLITLFLRMELVKDDVDLAYAEGVASVDITTDNQASFDAGAASVTPEDGIGQADVDAAYAEGAASVTPEDGIGQADVDAVQSELDAVNEALGGVQSELDAVNEALGTAMANQEDGIGQADVDAAAEQAYIEGIVSVEIEVETQNIPLDLPQGWSMFGYTCLESLDVVEAFSGISDSIEIVKDEWGLAYLPAWGFSAFDNLEFGEGYQIKMLEEVADFLFCETVIGYNPSMIIGCTDTAATNYNADANTDDGSCEFEPDYLLIGSWDMHSMYDLNLITGEWESVDLEDVGGADNIAFDADKYLLARL